MAANALDHLALGGRIEWLAELDTAAAPVNNYRRTSIICTIGPKTNSVEKINALREAGLNIVRMNFSHGSYEYHQSVIDNARAAEKAMPGRQVAIALDTKGPEIRTGNTKGDQDLPIAAGKILNITTDDKYATACDTDNMYVDYKNITKVIEPGRIIYVDDGILAFDVLEITNATTIKARARNNGFISSKKGVNLPNTDVDLPALSEKDKNDLRFGVKNNVDMVFAVSRSSNSEVSTDVLITCDHRALFGGPRIFTPSAKCWVRKGSTSRSLPRSRTGKASTTSRRSSPRPTASWLPEEISASRSPPQRYSPPRRS